MYHWYYFENIRRGSYQFPIEFYHVTEEHPRYIMPYHWHPDIEIIVVHQGKLTTSVDNKRYELQSADILYIPPNAVHGAIPYDCVYLAKNLSAGCYWNPLPYQLSSNHSRFLHWQWWLHSGLSLP